MSAEVAAGVEMAARRLWKVALFVGALGLLLFGGRARATVDMQNEAKALGFPVKNCLYCHATPHAVEQMKEKARELDMSDGNCLLCHGGDIPATLNDRGEWLVEEKARRGANEFSMAWLKDYVEPKPSDEPDTPEAPAKPANPKRKK